MDKLEMMIKALGYAVLVVLCIGIGLYAAYLNPSRTFEFAGMMFALSGLLVGMGAAVVATAIILLLMGEDAQENLENAAIPDKSDLHHVRNFLQVVSRHKAGLVTMLLIGLAPMAYWIARPLYLVRSFKPHLPEYLALTSTAPQNGFLAEGAPSTPGVENIAEEDEDKSVAPVQPDFGGNDAEEVAKETRAREEEIARNKKPVPSNLPIQGKIVPVDVTKKIIDPTFLDLSSDLRPSRPEEVGAVAAMWWWEQRVGHYGSGDPDIHGAFQQHCTVMVWDVATKSLLAKQSFAGGMPPRSSYWGNRQSGSRPYAEISDFLNHLPHR
jgi:hypothetical protein